MKFSTDHIWADAVIMARSNVSVLIAIGGVFLLLPQLAQSLFFAPPEIKAFDMRAVDMITKYFTDNALWLFLLNVPVAAGQAAILALLASPSRPSPAVAVSGTLPLLLAILVLNFMTNLAVMAGALLLIVPGIYLIGRLAVAAPAQMAERIGNPISAIQRSLNLTNANGWAIAGTIILITFVAYILVSAIGAVFGIVLTVIIPKTFLPAVLALLQSFLASATLVLMLIISATIYRQLLGGENKAM